MTIFEEAFHDLLGEQRDSLSPEAYENARLFAYGMFAKGVGAASTRNPQQLIKLAEEMLHELQFQQSKRGKDEQSH